MAQKLQDASLRCFGTTHDGDSKDVDADVGPLSLYLSSLRVANNAAAGADWACNIPRRLHHYLLREQERGDATPTVAEIGRMLAASIRTEPLLPGSDAGAMGAYPGTAETAGLICDVRLDTRAVLAITTTQHAQGLLRRGFLPCNSCGHFAAGTKGLRMHLQSAHGLDYSTAKSKMDTCAAAVKLVLEVTAAASSSSSPLAAAPCPFPGLEAAKKGDLGGLKALAERRALDPRDLRDTRDHHGVSALLWAAGSGHLEVCQW